MAVIFMVFSVCSNVSVSVWKAKTFPNSHQIQIHLIIHTSTSCYFSKEHYKSFSFRNTKTTNDKIFLRNNVSQFFPGFTGYLYKLLGKPLIES